MRKNYTMTEIFVAVVAIFILVTMMATFFIRAGYYQQKGAGVYQCVKTYTYQEWMKDHYVSQKRVDLRPQNGGMVETFTCDDDIYLGVMDSTTIYAQFQPGHQYQVEYTGYRREGLYSLFPSITSVKELDAKNENRFFKKSP